MSDDTIIGNDGPAAGATPPAGNAASAAPSSGQAAAGPSAGTASPVAGGQGAGSADPAPAWPGDWRQKIAGEDQDLLKRLDRFSDPKAMWESYRALERKFSERQQGTVAKRPGPDATAEEMAEYRKSMGVPEKPEGYLENLKLPDGRILGDDDKPIATDFAAAMHEANAPPEIVNKALGWYYDYMEAQQAQQFEADEAFKYEATAALKEQWGVEYKRNVGAIGMLFEAAPQGVKERLLTGRTADGNLIGNDPAVIQWLAQVAREMNPAAAVLPAANATPQGVESRISEIETIMRGPDPQRYWKDERMQAEYRTLLEARQRHAGRSAA